MTPAPDSPEKKIIIDEDWKSQVEAEKAAARQAEQAAPDAAARVEEPKSANAAQASSGSPVPLPPANLSFLVGTLYLQGAMALGLLPNPVTNKSEVHLDQAKHAIDLLAVLEAKTAGNRTPEESADLDAALHELRLVYVQRK
jgi:hypothetical protein